MSIQERLEQVLTALDAEWSDEDRQLAVDAGKRIAELMARDLAGEDVEAELDIAKATARNIAVAGSRTALAVIREEIAETLGVLVNKLI